MSMYNKIFTKILDSSVWLESTPTRIVWLTFIAAMDETGYCQFASVGNLASRARVSMEEAKEAVKVLEAPDPESADPDNEGRRIERVQGGWIVLNAEKYRALVTRANVQEKVRERVRRYRERKRIGNAGVTPGNSDGQSGNGDVTPSDTDSYADTKNTLPDGTSDAKNGSKVVLDESKAPQNPKKPKDSPSAECLTLYKAYPKHSAPNDAYRAIAKALTVKTFDYLLLAVNRYAKSVQGKDPKYIPYPASWFNAGHYDDETNAPPASASADFDDFAPQPRPSGIKPRQPMFPMVTNADR